MNHHTKRFLISGWVVGTVIWSAWDGVVNALRALSSPATPNREPAYLHKQYLRDRAELRAAAKRISV